MKEIEMKLIKRNGSEVTFDREKIVAAIESELKIAKAKFESSSDDSSKFRLK